MVEKNGEVSPKELDELLGSLKDELGEGGSESLYKAVDELFNMGVLRVVPKSIPIKDKGLILSSKVVVRAPTTWGGSTVGPSPTTRSKIPRSLRLKIQTAITRS